MMLVLYGTYIQGVLNVTFILLLQGMFSPSLYV
jgi:hypothetical protein